MKPGDLVQVLGICVFWREYDSPGGHEDFKLRGGEIMTLIDGPWTVQLDHSERGQRKETHVRVLHPAHGIIRGFHHNVETISEAG